MVPQYPQLTATLRFVAEKMDADPHLAGMLGEGAPLVGAILEYNPFEMGDDEVLELSDQQLPCLAMWPGDCDTTPEQGNAADGDDAEFTLFYGAALYHGDGDLQREALGHRIIHNVWWRIRRYLHRHRLDNTGKKPEFMVEGGIKSIRVQSRREFTGADAAGCFITLRMRYYAPPYELPPPVQITAYRNTAPLAGTDEKIGADGDFEDAQAEE